MRLSYILLFVSCLLFNLITSKQIADESYENPNEDYDREYQVIGYDNIKNQPIKVQVVFNEFSDDLNNDILKSK